MLLLMTMVIILTIPTVLTLKDPHNILNSPSITRIPFEEKVIITGVSCHNNRENIETRTIDVPETGKYKIYVKAERSGEVQQKEEYHLTILSTNTPGITSEDTQDSDPETIDFLGTFQLTKGKEKIRFRNHAECPPDETANSVHIDTIYLIPVKVELPEPIYNRSNSKGKKIDCPYVYIDLKPSYYNCPIGSPFEYNEYSPKQEENLNILPTQFQDSEIIILEATNITQEKRILELIQSSSERIIPAEQIEISKTSYSLEVLPKQSNKSLILMLLTTLNFLLLLIVTIFTSVIQRK
jgi:hypothetical protein